MKTISNKLTAFEKRRGERGAALITALLMTSLLLVAGGALIMTTSLSASNAIDSTAEAQAYYAAEAGLQATLDVLRGNGTANPSGTITMDFRNAITLDTNYYSNRNGDPSTAPRLSRWLNYSYNGDYTSANSRVSLGNNSSFTVKLYDPDGTASTAQPTRLLIHVTGYGPKGAVKQMEMIVSRVGFNFTPRSTIMMVGADDGSGMHFTLGSSNAKDYSGMDNAGSGSNLPAVGVTDASDKTIALNADTKGTVTGFPEDASVIPAGSLETWMKDADSARALLNSLQATAQAQDRYFTTYSGSSGSTTSPAFTFVDGDCTLTGGAGLLVVTGDLDMSGNPSFSGIILVLGNGTINRNGGGNGDTIGAIVVAKFARTWPASENGQDHPFLAPWFDTDGGGNSSVQYDSVWVQRAMNTMGRFVVGIAEK